MSNANPRASMFIRHCHARSVSPGSCFTSLASRGTWRAILGPRWCCGRFSPSLEQSRTYFATSVSRKAALWLWFSALPQLLWRFRAALSWMIAAPWKYCISWQLRSRFVVVARTETRGTFDGSREYGRTECFISYHALTFVFFSLCVELAPVSLLLQ